MTMLRAQSTVCCTGVSMQYRSPNRSDIPNFDLLINEDTYSLLWIFERHDILRHNNQCLCLPSTSLQVHLRQA